MLHYFVKEVEDCASPSGDSTLFGEYGNAIIHAIKDIPPTFKHTSLKILNLISLKQYFALSTDTYVDNSIKSQERKRRGTSQQLNIEGI